MTNAKKDENGRNSLTCISQDDGSTIVNIQANPTNHGIKIDDNTTGSDLGNNQGIALNDENSVPVCLALSSAADGTFVEVYATSDGKILINSN